MIELIYQALGKIAREASVWPPKDQRGTEIRIVAAVTDASEALVALEQHARTRPHLAARTRKGQPSADKDTDSEDRAITTEPTTEKTGYRTKRRAGQSLCRFIDLDQERQIRAWLRQSKRTKPGLTHSLHWLFDAYVELEAEHDALLARHTEAKKALTE